MKIKNTKGRRLEDGRRWFVTNQRHGSKWPGRVRNRDGFRGTVCVPATRRHRERLEQQEWLDWYFDLMATYRG